MVLLMMNATTVSARTRFNDLGNKLKSKAEKVVDDKKREVKGQVTLSSGNTAEAFDYNKKYAPSAEVSLTHLRPAPKRRRDAKVDTLCSTRITNIKVEIYLVCRHFSLSLPHAKTHRNCIQPRLYHWRYFRHLCRYCLQF